MDISVIIVGWNAKEHLERCLQSIAAAPPRRSTELIVVDNASTDGSAEMIKQRFPSVKLIRSEQNLGFAKGNSLGIRQSSGRYVSLVNPDVEVLPGCLDALATFLDQNSNVGNVGPRVFNPDMTQQSTCRRFPTLWNNFCAAAALASTFKRSKMFAGEHMWFFAHDRTIEVDVLVGCFWMVRRETLDTVGSLDENFFMYGEDLDWCRRCWKAGWKVVFFPGARAIHYRGGSSAAQPVRCAVEQQTSILYYWSKYHSLLGIFGIRAIMLFHHLLRYSFALLSRLVTPDRQLETDLRRQMSAACLRRIFSGGLPRKA